MDNKSNELIVIDSVYINLSGGKTLLEIFIKTFLKEKYNKNVYFLFDIRLNLDKEINLTQLRHSYIENTENSRKAFYKKNKKLIKTIFCFGNVPPPISIQDARVFILFHNTLLINSRINNFKNFKSSIIFYLKRIYIRSKNKENYFWIVQTPLVKKSLLKKIKIFEKNIYVLPFFNNEWPSNINKQKEINENNFLYVADGSEQKNHLKLFEAIELLPQNLVKSLNFYFTIPLKHQRLIKIISQLKNNGYNVFNYKYCTKNELEILYEKCNYLLYPSLTESFGLPLLEAAKAGCKIIASDMPYVYEIVDPIEVFNPKDSISISKAIQNVSKNKNYITTPLKITNQINEILNLILC